MWRHSQVRSPWHRRKPWKSLAASLVCVLTALKRLGFCLRENDFVHTKEGKNIYIYVIRMKGRKKAVEGRALLSGASMGGRGQRAREHRQPCEWEPEILTPPLCSLAAVGIVMLRNTCFRPARQNAVFSVTRPQSSRYSMNALKDLLRVRCSFTRGNLSSPHLASACTGFGSEGVNAQKDSLCVCWLTVVNSEQAWSALYFSHCVQEERFDSNMRVQVKVWITDSTWSLGFMLGDALAVHTLYHRVIRCVSAWMTHQSFLFL